VKNFKNTFLTKTISPFTLVHLQKNLVLSI